MGSGSIFFVMTLEEYKMRLEKHDWYHIMSDDPHKFDAGQKEEAFLLGLTVDNPEFLLAYLEIYRKNFFIPDTVIE